MSKQRTLAKAFEFAGRGLHLGQEAKVKVGSGAAGSGFVFKCGGVELTAGPDAADGSRQRTVLGRDGTELHTVEHLLAALFGSGVDNALIEVEGAEIPGGDGSAKNFADQIGNVGTVEQEAEAKVLTLAAPLSVSENGAVVTAFPAADGQFRVTYVLDYPESPLARGTAEFVVTPDTFQTQIAPCRTFVMKQHAEALLRAGLGLGASAANTLVLDGEKVIDNELRFPDECARHKALDLVGDLALVGRRLGVHVVAYKSGHKLNLKLAQALRREALRQDHPRGILDIKAIEKRLPHRYPFLLVDRVLELEFGRRIVAYKNLTFNEEFFQGHFPGQPIMPGVLQVEALAQTGCLLFLAQPEYQGKLAVLMGVENVKWRRPVVPGDQLMMEVVTERVKGRMGIVNAKATVEGEITTEATIKCMLIDPENYT